ncbi:hypothetical protein GGI12_002013 [Dipsacomyces acuminosporus]|nr:hypothetical protein GGI12_002013 [Dipsacomyces acuminosporus]
MVLSQIPWLDYLEQLNVLLSEVGYTRVLATSAGAYAAYKLIHALYLSPLRGVPGPLLARLTDKRAELFGASGDQARKGLEEYEKYGDVYVYKPDSISICNPTDVRKVLGTHQFVKSDFYKTLDVLGSETTNSARDPQFASMRRRQIGPYFSNAYLARMEEAILKHGIASIKETWERQLGQSANGQIEVNYHKSFLYAMFDTIGNLSFGREFGCLKNDDAFVEKWLKGTLTFFGAKTTFPLLKFFPFSLILSPHEHLYKEFLNYAIECIDSRRGLLGELEANGEIDKKPVDLLQGLVDCEDPESKSRMSPDDITAETILLLVAGSETSANTLMTTVHLLMLYPLCFKRAVEEVRSAFDKDHLITFAEAKTKLPYLEACIYESLRHSPVTGGQWPRVAPKEGASLGGHFIPGGTEININIAGTNMNKNYWNNPHLFDPTRFLNNDEAKRNVFTFSYGVRVCPGRQLAWIEMLTILSNILKDYDLRYPDDYTLHGPNILNEHGYPKLMDSKLFITNGPTDSERDCRVVVSKRA